MTSPIPVIKVPYTGGPRVTRAVEVEWPHCPTHEEVPLVKKNPLSFQWYCSGGHHFVLDSEVVHKKVIAYEIIDYPAGG